MVHFKERQRFQNRLIITFLALIGIATAIKGITICFETNPHYINGLFLLSLSIISGVLVWWLHQLNLKVKISDKKIKLNLSPAPFMKQSIPLKDIESCKIVKTPEAAQWHGRNISFNHEHRYSLSGRNGVLIKTKTGERYFIGSNKMEKLEKVLQKIFNNQARFA